jgi:hypothetical protein
VILSAGGERAAELALALERRGHRFVAAMMGGIVAWRDLGFATSRDPEILGRRGLLHELGAARGGGGQLSRDDVLRHVGDPSAVRWMKLAALLVNGRISCVDGRDDSGIIGTPGGDGGEFLLALAALETISGRTLDRATIDRLLSRRVDTFGRFYLHTDVRAVGALIGSMQGDRRLDRAIAGIAGPLEWRRFLAAPPEGIRDVLLEHVLQPAHVGCGHIKMMIERAAEYGVRRELVLDVLRAFYERRWGGMPDLELAPLAGGHAEGAVLEVRLARGVQAFSWIPLVSPSAFGEQAFVNHPQVSAFLRRQTAEWLTLQDDLVGLPRAGGDALAAEIERLAAVQLGNTLGALARGLPVYEVLFDEGRIEVAEKGRVPG